MVAQSQIVYNSGKNRRLITCNTITSPLRSLFPVGDGIIEVPLYVNTVHSNPLFMMRHRTQELQHVLTALEVASLSVVWCNMHGRICKL